MYYLLPFIVISIYTQSRYAGYIEPQLNDKIVLIFDTMLPINSQVFTRKQKRQEPLPFLALWKRTKKLYRHEAGSSRVKSVDNPRAEASQGLNV